MKFKKTVLKNGMRIVTIPQPNAVAMTALILVETGSKYETKKNAGIAHFLEHMCFKGTKSRPNSSQIAQELENLGAASNAFTSQEYTGYYTKVSGDKAEKALDIVADLYLNPVFKREEIEKEKGVIIEEFNMYEDMPQRKVTEYFMELLYGDQPAGREILGSKDVIRRMRQKDFVDFRKDHYLPQATTLVLAGKINEKEIIAQARKLFSKMKRAKKQTKKITTENQKKPALFVKYKDCDQTHIVFGYRAFGLFDQRRIILSVLAHVLGGGMSSRLFSLLREKMGAAYYVWADADLYTDHGLIAAGAGIQLAQVPNALLGIKKEFQKLTKELVKQEELDRVKNHLSGILVLGLETSDSLAVSYGIQELLRKKVITPDELVEKIYQVKAEDLRRLAKELFVPQRMNLAIIGPYKNKAKFKKLLLD